MTTYVDVPVTNIDTVSPMITNHSFTVAENANIGTVIGTVKSSDNIAVIYYLITTGNPGYVFTINTNGELRNIMKLDHDTTSNYSLTVQVSDAAGNTSNATITVNVTDVDASPTVITIGASGTQNNSVTLNGNLTNLGINNDGSMQVNEYGFIYSTNASEADSLQLGKNGVEKIAGDNIANTGSYSHVSINLSPGTIHYFRAFAINDGGVSYGGVSNFSTTYHKAFALSGATDGMQSNTVHAQSAHTYTIPLSHSLSYSLTIEADTNLSDNVTIYEGNNTEPLYIRPGPFTLSSSGSTQVTFSEINNGTRYLVLPLTSNTHRVLISNHSSSQSQNYSLNLAEYSGINPNTDRLLTEPQKMGYYDSTNGTGLFLVHVPPNKHIEVELDAHRFVVGAALRVIALNSTIVFNLNSTDTQKLGASTSSARYTILSMDNPAVAGSVNYRQTNARLIFRFVD